MYNQIKYLINFVENKMLRTKCVYNILQNKLIAIQKYLANALKKNQIYSLNNSIKFLVLFVKKSNSSLRFNVNYCKLNKITIKNKYFFSFFQRCLSALQIQNILLKLIYAIRIIAFEFVKTINKKQLFALNISNLSIRLCFLILLTLLLSFNFI